MRLAVDIGNTRVKLGLFEQQQLVETQHVSTYEQALPWLVGKAITDVIISSVGVYDSRWENIALNTILLTSDTSLPISLQYDTPTTLGMDRVAAVVGAYSIYQNVPCLVIDAGTCITMDVLTEKGVYVGGVISPGISMRLKAMHDYTASLPLLTPELQNESVGKSTQACMRQGAVNGAIREVNGYLSELKTIYPSIQTVLCGGDSNFFESTIKDRIFVHRELVLHGLNAILIYHAG